MSSKAPPVTSKTKSTKATWRFLQESPTASTEPKENQVRAERRASLLARPPLDQRSSSCSFLRAVPRHSALSGRIQRLFVAWWEDFNFACGFSNQPWVPERHPLPVWIPRTFPQIGPVILSVAVGSVSSRLLWHRRRRRVLMTRYLSGHVEETASPRTVKEIRDYRCVAGIQTASARRDHDEPSPRCCAANPCSPALDAAPT